MLVQTVIWFMLIGANGLAALLVTPRLSGLTDAWSGKLS